MRRADIFHSPVNKPASQKAYAHHLKWLRKVFGHMQPKSIQPHHAYQYRNKRAETARVAANREVSVLVSALTFAVEQGWLERDNLKGQISRHGAASERPLQRVPTFEELEQFCSLNPHLRSYVALKAATGLRKGQLLSINLSKHWDGEILHPPTSKGGKDTQYLNARPIIQNILKNRMPVRPLFCSSRGIAFSKSSFASLWRRAIDRFIKEGGIKFNEHDTRKTVANEADNLEHAQRLLGHQDAKTTSSTYRIGRPETVRVLINSEKL